jgi:hypothetical protein
LSQYTGCQIKKANFPPSLTLGVLRISNAPNVKFGGKFAFLIGHPVLKYFEVFGQNIQNTGAFSGNLKISQYFGVFFSNFF